jgi:hypothetical protein
MQIVLHSLSLSLSLSLFVAQPYAMYAPFGLATTVPYHLLLSFQSIQKWKGPRRETMMMQRYSDCSVCGEQQCFQWTRVYAHRLNRCLHSRLQSSDHHDRAPARMVSPPSSFPLLLPLLLLLRSTTTTLLPVLLPTSPHSANPTRARSSVENASGINGIILANNNVLDRRMLPQRIQGWLDQQ